MRGDGSRAFKKPGDGKGDLIDLSKIDADWGTAGDQAFEFGKQTGEGRLWAENRGSDTYIFGNTDDDAAAELKIVIADGSNRASDYTANDFIL